MHRLYEAYITKYPESKVTYKFYSKVIKQNFPNLRFRQPRCDTCRKCDLLHCEIKAKGERSFAAKEELKLHHLKASRATTLMKEDISLSQNPGSSKTVISMDLEQVIFVPILTHADMFYLSQLSCYNLCVFGMKEWQEEALIKFHHVYYTL